MGERLEIGEKKHDMTYVRAEASSMTALAGGEGTRERVMHLKRTSLIALTKDTKIGGQRKKVQTSRSGKQRPLL